MNRVYYPIQGSHSNAAATLDMKKELEKKETSDMSPSLRTIHDSIEFEIPKEDKK